MKDEKNKETNYEKITIEKTNRIIKKFLLRFKGSDNALEKLRKQIRKESEKIVPCYVELVQSYQKISEVKDYSDEVKDFLMRYKALVGIVKKVISHKDNKELAEMIYITWTVVLKKLAEKSGHDENHFVSIINKEFRHAYNITLKRKGITPYC
jgi:hypothetical protein